jgi:hypothetical protein
MSRVVQRPPFVGESPHQTCRVSLRNEEATPTVRARAAAPPRDNCSATSEQDAIIVHATRLSLWPKTGDCLTSFEMRAAWN